MKTQILFSTVFFAGLLMVGAANAGTATATMGVGATVTTVCSVTETDVAFGEMSLVGDTNGVGGVQATCTNGGGYTVSLDNGLHAAGAQRTQVSGANVLNYNLFSDAAYTVPWNATPGPGQVSGTGNGSAQALVVYGKIPGGQLATTGTYADTVTVTIAY